MNKKEINRLLDEGVSIEDIYLIKKMKRDGLNKGDIEEIIRLGRENRELAKRGRQVMICSGAAYPSPPHLTDDEIFNTEKYWHLDHAPFPSAPSYRMSCGYTEHVKKYGVWYCTKCGRYNLTV